MADARKAALNALEKCRRSSAWSDAVLGSVMDAQGLDKRDRGLASALCYGVLQNKILLDYYIEQHSSKSIRQIEPKVLDILRISVYQIIMMDRIPSAIAVNEGVRLCRISGFSRATGFVNAILRRISESTTAAPTGLSVEALSIRYSHPVWLTKLFVDRLGAENAERLLQCNNADVPVTLQVNTLITNTESLMQELNEQGIATEMHPFLPNCLLLYRGGNISEIKPFLDGKFYVQDAAAKIAVHVCQPENGQRIIDVCSAPGGKSFAAAIISNGADVVSCDLHENKLKRIRDGANRLHLKGIETYAMDARSFYPAFSNRFDAVIADVPCSGLGVIRKKPDIRYKNPKEFESLPSIQYSILENVSKYVKVGGTLLYSTCTIRCEENENVVSSFLENNINFETVDFLLPFGEHSKNGMFQFWPHSHSTDGFFVAKMRKIL